MAVEIDERLMAVVHGVNMVSLQNFRTSRQQRNLRCTMASSFFAEKCLDSLQISQKELDGFLHLLLNQTTHFLSI